MFIVEHRAIPGIEETEMDVGAAAHAMRRRQRRKTHPLPQPKRHRLRQLARDHGIIGRSQAHHRRRSDLILARAVLRQERIGYDADLTQCRQ